jgi:tetratricopeptide (TPR) repeat protein
MTGCLSLLVLIAYSNSLGNGYVWDDHKQIEMNPDLRAGAPWTALFSSDVWSHLHHQTTKSNYYRPLQMVSYRAVSELFGPNPGALHLLSVLLALASVLAAFWVYHELTRRPELAFGAAALFAVHPAHSEAVDWISALPEIGCTACTLVALGCFLAVHRGVSESTTSKKAPKFWVLWFSSLAFFAAALLWKETAAIFPLIVAGYIFCIETGSVGQRTRLAAKFSLSFWCVAFAYLLVRLRILGFLAMRQRIWELTPIQVALNGLHLLTLYWWKLAFPIHLNAYYLFSPVRSPWDMRAVTGFVFLAVSCIAIGYGLRRNRLAAFAAIWVFITLLPVMNIYALGRNVFAERYLYLPSVGFCLLVILLANVVIQRLPVTARKPTAALALAAVVALLCWTTVARNPDWHDDATLFRETLIRAPNAPFVHFMVASTAGDDSGEAELHYRRAIELAEQESPMDVLDLTLSYEGLASLYSDRGDYAHALDMVHRWRAIAPNQPELDAEEGLILLRTGDQEQAEPLLKKAYVARPQDENVLNALGLLAWEYKRNLPEAAAFFSNALAIHTSQDEFRASLHSNLGGVYGDGGQFPLAIEQFESAVSISPGNPEYRTNLANAMAGAGRYSDAASQASLALRADPNYAPARDLLKKLQREKP